MWRSRVTLLHTLKTFVIWSVERNFVKCEFWMGNLVHTYDLWAHPSVRPSSRPRSLETRKTFCVLCTVFTIQIPCAIETIKIQPGYFHCNPFIFQNRIMAHNHREQHQKWSSATSWMLWALSTQCIPFYRFNWIRGAFHFCHSSADIVYIDYVIKSHMIYFYNAI